jgi:hypothetical protein
MLYLLVEIFLKNFCRFPKREMRVKGQITARGEGSNRYINEADQLSHQKFLPNICYSIGVGLGENLKT